MSSGIRARARASGAAMRCSMLSIPIAALLLGCASPTNSSPPIVEPVRTPPVSARSSEPEASTAWQDVLDQEAAHLVAEHPGAQVRLLAVDLASGDTLAKHGDVATRHHTASTMKTLTLLAALRLGLDPTLVVDLSGPVMVDDVRVQDWKAHGPSAVADVLTYSSNVGVARIAEHVPWEAMQDEVRAFVSWEPADNKAEAVLLLMGATSKASLVELAHGYRAALSDPDHGAFLVEALHEAVGPRGTGTQGNVEGLFVAGKTGTEAIEGKVDALFVGVAGDTSPQTLVAVAVAGLPEGGGTGGSVAAPAFARIITAAQR